MASRFTRAALAGMLALSMTTGAVVPTAHAAESAVEIARKAAKDAGSSQLDEGSSALGSSDKKSKKTGGFDKSQLSSTLGADSIQKWFNNSPGIGQQILTILGVLIALDVLGIVLGPIRSALFNMAGVR